MSKKSTKQKAQNVYFLAEILDKEVRELRTEMLTVYKFGSQEFSRAEQATRTTIELINTLQECIKI